MSDKAFVYACTLRTFGIDEERFEKICVGLRRDDIDIKFEEKDLVGKIFISKSSVDSIALESVLSKMTIRLEDYIYSDRDVALNYALVRTLQREDKMIAVSESITGGLVCSNICDISGASDVLYEGIISYNNAAKVRRLHVPTSTIEEYSSVSSQTCEAMLKGVLANKEVEYGMATTGYATHKESDKAGTAYIGYGKLGDLHIEHVSYTGSRNSIRAKVTNHIMFKLLKLIEFNTRNY